MASDLGGSPQEEGHAQQSQREGTFVLNTSPPGSHLEVHGAHPRRRNNGIDAGWLHLHCETVIFTGYPRRHRGLFDFFLLNRRYLQRSFGFKASLRRCRMAHTPARTRIHPRVPGRAPGWQKPGSFTSAPLPNTPAGQIARYCTDFKVCIQSSQPPCEVHAV